jgi:hypothetical protein
MGKTSAGHFLRPEIHLKFCIRPSKNQKMMLSKDMYSTHKNTIIIKKMLLSNTKQKA